MNVSKASIGKLQISIGIIIFVVAVFFLIWGVVTQYRGTLNKAETEVIKSWNTISDAKPGSVPGIQGHLVSGLTNIAMAYKMAQPIFVGVNFILIVLALMFIFQGLANIARK